MNVNSTESSHRDQDHKSRGTKVEMGSSTPAPFRPIMPGPSFSETKAPAQSRRNMSSSWKKRVSTACLSCKKSKRKCSGTPPCDNCRALQKECIFDESLDQRRRIAAKRTAEELEYHRDMLNDLFKVIRSASEQQATRLLSMIRSDATPEEIRVFIDEVLAHLQASEPPSDTKRDTAEQLKALRSRANMQGSAPSFRRQVMDVNFLCVIPPLEVPAKPWTTVSDDDAFVSHLISLYFTWDYPFYSFLDKTVLVNHMKSRDLSSEFCSPFLVNALLAHACSYSEYSEAYGVPGDVTTKGATFLKEAERCLAAQGDKATMSTLQGTMILYERYSMTGQDNLGYAMLYKAIDIADKMGYTGGEGQDIDLSDKPKEVYNSTIKTIWGLFQVDTVAHTGFLKPCHIKNVRLTRFLDLSLDKDSDLWEPYPSQASPRCSYGVTYFHESCALSEIARDISTSLFADGLNDDKGQLSRAVGSLYRRLREWHDSLPGEFDISTKPATHILLLHIRYHTILISMFNCPRGHNHRSKSVDIEAVEATATTTTPPALMPETGQDPASIATCSARAIAQLVRVHQEEYGMSRSHVFALYAVNLALFLLLDYGIFDISDPDCIALTSAFAVMTTRSILGQEVRSVFRRSIRKRTGDHRESLWDQLPEGMKEILEDNSSEDEGGAWEHSDDDGDDGDDVLSSGSVEASPDAASEPLSPATGAERQPRNTKQKRAVPQQGPTGLCEMLCRYETMTLGRDDHVTGKRQ